MKSQIIDFLLNKYLKKKKLHPKAGCMHGYFNTHSGFDEPLNDFKEYLE